MVARTFQCDPVRLKSFLDDDLAEREQIELNDHLESCALCQRSLERLAGRKRVLGRATAVEALGLVVGLTLGYSVPETGALRRIRTV